MKTYKIGEVSKLFNIPASTIRYWDDQGLIHLDRDPENGYRVITNDTIHDISEAILYRSINVSMEEYRMLRKMSLDDFSKTLESALAKVEESITQYNAIRNRLLVKLSTLQKIDLLKEKPYAFCTPDMERVVPWHTFNGSDMQQYLNASERFALVIYPPLDAGGNASLSAHDGFIVPADPKDQTKKLWELSETSGRFVQCLMKLQRNHYVAKDLEEHLQALKRLGLIPGTIVGRFLAEEISPHDNIHYEYYQAFIEVS